MPLCQNLYPNANQHDLCDCRNPEACRISTPPRPVEDAAPLDRLTIKEWAEKHMRTPKDALDYVYGRETGVWEGRHPDSQRFHDRLKTAGDLHDRKQADYGTGEDPFANIRRCERYGIPAWVGCAIRMADKMARIERAVGQWARGEEVTMANEALLDSFDDLTVYSNIGAILYEDAQK